MALRRTLSALFTGTVAVWAAFGSAAAPLSRSELLSLVERKVDPERIAAIVRAECVDFDVDAAALAELCPRVPPAALLAAIECRIVNRGSPRAAPAAAAPPPRAPAAEPPVARPEPVRPPPLEAPSPRGVEPAPAANAEEAWLRLAAPAVKTGCFLFVDYAGPVTRLKLRGTITSGLRLGNWESEFRGEPYWWLPITAGGTSAAAVVPPGRHSLTCYCDGGWYRSGITGELTAGRMHTLVIKSAGGDDLSIEGVRLEPPDAPLPGPRDRVHPAIAR